MASWSSTIFFVSVTTADRPLTKHFSPAVFRTCSMASIVSSEEDPSSKNTALSIQSPRLNFSRISSGMISTGSIPFVREAYPITESTWGISFSAFSMFCCSGMLMPSVTSREKAPFPKSSSRIFCPFTVSRSWGR